MKSLKWLHVGICLLLAVTTIPESESGGQPATIESPRLAALLEEITGGREDSLQAFWAGVGEHGTPLIEPIEGDEKNMLVTFLWRSDNDSNVVIMSEPGHNVRARLLTRLLNTDVWHKTWRLPRDARFLYQLSVNDPAFPFEGGPITNFPTQFQPDPLNPRRWGEAHSLVELPAAPLKWSEPAPGVPKGQSGRVSGDFKSKVLGEDRKIIIYLPPGFSTEGERYDLMVMGASYSSMIPLPTILDNLLAAGLIRPTVVLFIDHPPGAQDRELSCDPKYAEFLAREFVPAMRERFHATDDPKRTVIGGASISGLSAAHVALEYPDVFGNVLSQSGSFWWSPDGDTEDQWLTRQVATRPAVPVQFFLSIGTLESGYAFRDGLISMLHANRHFRDVLLARGYDVTFREINGGHDPYNWQVTLVDGLIMFLGRKNDPVN